MGILKAHLRAFGSGELKINELSIDQLKRRFAKLQSGWVNLSVPMIYNLLKVHTAISQPTKSIKAITLAIR